MKMRTIIFASVMNGLVAVSLLGVEVRSAVQSDYAGKLWEFAEHSDYKSWSQFRGEFPIDVGPGDVGEVTVYLNSRARKNLKKFSPGSAIVCEHFNGEVVVGVTIYAFRKSDSWFWAHYLPTGEVVKTSADRNPFEKDEFYTFVRDGRLWVFPLGSKALAEFKESGSYEKYVTMPGAGPGGMTIKGPSSDDIRAYMTSRDGFATKVVDGRLWVFTEGTAEADDLRKGEFSEKHLTVIGAGPMGMTMKSLDRSTIDDYLTRKSGFETAMIDGRLWVFRSGSQEWDEFNSKGASDKHVTQVGVGPEGITVKAPDRGTIVDYMTSANGFRTVVDDGRLWVFVERSPALAEYLESGEPAKCVTRVGDGPLGMTVKSDDGSTIDMYLAAIAN